MSLSFMQHNLKIAADFSTLSHKARSILGWLHDMEGYCLLQLAQSGPGVGSIVEIGAFMGRSTFWLATGSARASREKVVAIDHFQGSSEHQADGAFPADAILTRGSTLDGFKDNMRRLKIEDKVEVLPLPSKEAAANWSGPIRLLFIDGEHSRHAVQDDFTSWSPFVVPSGIVAFHDYGNPNFPGVKAFCDSLVKQPGYFILMRIQHLLVLQKAASGN